MTESRSSSRISAKLVPIRKLTAAVHEKVWGSPRTEPWLANPEGRKIGEIWFSAPDVMPVLVKLLFTSERLSVQVHPDDSYALAHGADRGKTEMWHILRADPGATIAVGLREPVSGKRLRESALNGEIVDLLDWVPAHAGDTFFVPAGTIHAIGGGIGLIEIQQLSDVTYRLFDYQRKPERELHLDDSLAVASLAPTRDGKRELPVECAYFRAERLEVCGSADCSASAQPAIYVAIAGEGKIDGESFRSGEAWLALAGARAFSIEAANASFIVASCQTGVN